MLPEYDNAVRLMNSEESLQDLLANFLGTDEEGRPWLDFAKIAVAAHEQREAVIRRQLLDTPAAVSQEDLEYIRWHEQFKKEVHHANKFAWHRANYGAEYFGFPSPQLMWFFNRGNIMASHIYELAILIRRPLRFSWMHLQDAKCGWCYCEPDGDPSAGSCDFESGLAPEWLWSDQGREDSSWAQEWVKILCGGKRDE